MNHNIFLFEDHDEAVKAWREKKVKALDLVHIDAHIDFGFYPAKPIPKIFNEAKTFKELKQGLEYSLAFLHYEKDFNKQADIGNYIYPAMQEGIVRDFYWVVPGGLKEFKKSAKFIKNILRNLLGVRGQKVPACRPPAGEAGQAGEAREKEGIIQTELLGRKFTICVLEKLPILKQKILLDIDTDFLIIDSLLNADNTKNIGKRKPWISPQDLVDILKKKIRHPRIITIAYSVNGGYTPIVYKHLGDWIAYHYAPGEFKSHFKNNSDAAYYFNLFSSTHKKEFYQKAVRLNPDYRAEDNNYGPLFLSLRKFSLAKKEFLRILCADPNNPACLFGLGSIALKISNFKKAKIYFSYVLNSGNRTLFKKIKNQSLFGLARAEFGLKNFKKAKGLLVRYRAIEPLQAESYYLLGYILEKEKDFTRSAKLYQDAIRLGFGGIEPISRLLKIVYQLEEKNGIIKYIIAKYKAFKKGFLKAKKLNSKKKAKGLHTIEKRMRILEKRLQRIGCRLAPHTANRKPQTAKKGG